MAAELESDVIVYLRPLTAETMAILDLGNNERSKSGVAPQTPQESSDIPPKGINGPALTTHLQNCTNHELDQPSRSRDSTPDPFVVQPKICRLKFDSKASDTTQGFVFGSRPDSSVKLALSGENRNYFRIHYNLNSGALLIMAIDKIEIGYSKLEANETLLLMANMVIKILENLYRFEIEFPDLAQCTDEHKRNYRRYVQSIGAPDAPYLPSLRLEDPYIGDMYKSNAVLGRGGFGEVHKATHIETGDCIAIKILAPGDEYNKIHGEMAEVNALSSLFHANIIKCHGAFKFNGRLCIQMELAVNDLFKHWNARKGNKLSNSLSLECIRSIGRQALSALEYLHSEGKVHRDLKPQNILVTGWDPKTDIPTIKLADFGLASLKSAYNTVCGTLGWVAPEVAIAMGQADEFVQREPRLRRSARNSKFRFESSVDIWALGKVLKTLVQDVPQSRKVHGKIMPINKRPAESLIEKMMQSTPEKRPTASECLMDPWVVSDDS